MSRIAMRFGRVRPQPAEAVAGSLPSTQSSSPPAVSSSEEEVAVATMATAGVSPLVAATATGGTLPGAAPVPILRTTRTTDPIALPGAATPETLQTPQEVAAAGTAAVGALLGAPAGLLPVTDAHPARIGQDGTNHPPSNHDRSARAPHPDPTAVPSRLWTTRTTTATTPTGTEGAATPETPETPAAQRDALQAPRTAQSTDETGPEREAASQTPLTPQLLSTSEGQQGVQGVPGVAAAQEPVPAVVPVVAAVRRPLRHTAVGLIEIGWDGQPLALPGDFVVLDTETVVETDRAKVPQLVLLAATNGSRNVIVPPAQVGAFILAHRHCRWVMYNAAFDVWVLIEHLRTTHPEAVEAIFTAAEQGRVHDAMLLDQALRLATSDGEEVPPRSLEQVADQYSRLPLNKAADAVYRLHYAELRGFADLATVADDGWFTYAIRDVQATLECYAALAVQAHDLVTGPYAHLVRAEATQRWGLLSEHILVLGAIALSAATRNGLHVDRVRQRELRQRLQKDIVLKAGQVNAVIQQDSRLQRVATALYVCDANGQFRRTPRGALSRPSRLLLPLLNAVLDGVEQSTGQRPPIARTPRSGQMSTSVEAWSGLRGVHPFVDGWLEIELLSKLLQFTADVGERVNPKYHWTRTGRFSSSDQNIQNIPRTSGIREMYIPAAGYVLLAADYAQVELRVLAQICFSRFGFSRLRDVLASGVDPHAYTAASIMRVDLKTLAARPDFKELRQRAKAINFGVPGGMGAAALAAYARANYGVSLSIDEAAAWRDRLIKDVYPELSLYLQSDDMAALARNLGVDTETCWAAFQRVESDGRIDRGGYLIGHLRRIIAGQTTTRDGRLYDPASIAQVWQRLRMLCRNPRVQPLLDGKEGEAAALRLFSTPAATLTGRVRSACTYTQSRNSPFQGLAADGAVLALFELVRRGWRVAAFVHDEVLTEIPIGCDYDAKAAELVEVMVSCMQQVCPDVPIECGAPVVMTRWSKNAEPVRDAQGRLLAWSPPSSPGLI